MTTRAEHMTWCKERAQECLDADNQQEALLSMFSDLGKHPETQGHHGIQMGATLALSGQLSTKAQVHDFVIGFN